MLLLIGMLLFSHGLTRAEPSVDESTICGPVALYVALRTLDLSVSFQDVQHQCGWTPINGVRFGSLVEVLKNRDDVDCLAGAVSYSDLRRFVAAEGVAIIAIRRGVNNAETEVIDHVVCIVRVDDELVGLEYPEGHTHWSELELSKCWTGEAILIRRRYGTFYSVAALVIGIICVMLIVVRNLSPSVVHKH